MKLPGLIEALSLVLALCCAAGDPPAAGAVLCHCRATERPRGVDRGAQQETAACAAAFHHDVSPTARRPPIERRPPLPRPSIE